MEVLSIKLKEFRDEKGWNQTQMSEYLEVGERTYQDIEKNGLVKKTADFINQFVSSLHS